MFRRRTFRETSQATASSVHSPESFPCALVQKCASVLTENAHFRGLVYDAAMLCGWPLQPVNNITRQRTKAPQISCAILRQVTEILSCSRLPTSRLCIFNVGGHRFTVP